jgi:hypothetical protein
MDVFVVMLARREVIGVDKKEANLANEILPRPEEVDLAAPSTVKASVPYNNSFSIPKEDMDNRGIWWCFLSIFLFVFHLHSRNHKWYLPLPPIDIFVAGTYEFPQSP